MNFAQRWTSKKTKSGIPKIIDNTDKTPGQRGSVSFVDGFADIEKHTEGGSVGFVNGFRDTENEIRPGGCAKSDIPKSIDKTDKTHPDAPVIEFLDMVRGGHARIHTDGRGALWWSAPRYYDDPGSLSYICEIWGEAVDGMFNLLESGGLNSLLCGGGRHAL